MKAVSRALSGKLLRSPNLFYFGPVLESVQDHVEDPVTSRVEELVGNPVYAFLFEAFTPPQEEEPPFWGSVRRT